MCFDFYPGEKKIVRILYYSHNIYEIYALIIYVV